MTKKEQRQEGAGQRRGRRIGTEISGLLLAVCSLRGQVTAAAEKGLLRVIQGLDPLGNERKLSTRFCLLPYPRYKAR